MYRKSMREALAEARAYTAVNEVKVSKGGKTLSISKKDVEVEFEDNLLTCLLYTSPSQRD